MNFCVSTKQLSNTVHTSDAKGMGFHDDLELDNANCLTGTRELFQEVKEMS